MNVCTCDHANAVYIFFQKRYILDEILDRRTKITMTHLSIIFQTLSNYKDHQESTRHSDILSACLQYVCIPCFGFAWLNESPSAHRTTTDSRASWSYRQSRPSVTINYTAKPSWMDEIMYLATPLCIACAQTVPFIRPLVHHGSAASIRAGGGSTMIPSGGTGPGEGGNRWQGRRQSCPPARGCSDVTDLGRASAAAGTALMEVKRAQLVRPVRRSDPGRSAAQTHVPRIGGDSRPLWRQRRRVCVVLYTELKIDRWLLKIVCMATSSSGLMLPDWSFLRKYHSNEACRFDVGMYVYFCDNLQVWKKANQ